MKELVCIICPNSCRLTVTEQNKEIQVKGAKCSRGVAFATQETVNPKRTLCTTVRTLFPDYPVISVKTSGDIDKNKIFMAMNEINKMVVDRRVHTGDVLVPNFLNMGVDLVVTTEMKQEESHET